ncbi:hypothetical protein [Actinomadura sp. NTSP31]|uniref:hypothetical protein n=1 Tax=Actinomadura sp. NTSP31 TaxID=1735447 RepID=UPI0035BEDD9F
MKRSVSGRRAAGTALAAGVPLAALVAAVPAAVQPETAAASAAPPSAAVRAAAPRRADFGLRHGANLDRPLRALGERLARSGVQALINGSGQRHLASGCGGAAKVPAGSRIHCFDKQDSATEKWYPQGVTTVSDAAVDGRWGAGRPILVSWHNHGAVRLTFVNPDRRTYRHVLLVYPVIRNGKVSYSDVALHAGGIAWFGDRLYVADTRAGLRVFDMRQIYDLGRSRNGSTQDAERVGLHDGKYYGHGYRYVMPQTGSWQYAHGWAGAKCTGHGAPRVSWMSVDRTAAHPSLIAGEYCKEKEPRGRVATWPLRNGTGIVAGHDGVAYPDWVASLPGDRTQGGVRAHGHWWFTQSHGSKRGTLLQADQRGHGWRHVSKRTISYGPEDLSCHRAQHRVWTLAEYPHKRALWGLPAPQCRW